MANIPVSTDINSLLTAATGTPSKDALGVLGAVKKGTGDIVAADIAAGAVIEAKILDGAVTAGKIGANAVTTIKIADDNVTTAKIVDGAVTVAKTTGVQASLVSGTNIRSVNGTTLLGSGDLAVTGSDVINVTAAPYNAYGDGRRFDTASMVAASTTLTATGSPFVSGDVGKYIRIHGVGTLPTGTITASGGVITNVTLTTGGSVGAYPPNLTQLDFEVESTGTAGGSPAIAGLNGVIRATTNANGQIATLSILIAGTGYTNPALVFPETGFISQIATFINGNSITLAQTNPTAFTSKSCFFGHDDSAAIQAALNAAYASSTIKKVYVPAGIYLCNVKSNSEVQFIGAGGGVGTANLIGFSNQTDRQLNPTILMPAVAYNPVVFLASAGGSTVSRMLIHGCAAQTGYGLKVGTSYGAGFVAMGFRADQLNIAGFNYAVALARTADCTLENVAASYCYYQFYLTQADELHYNDQITLIGCYGNFINGYYVYSSGSKNINIIGGDFTNSTHIAKLKNGARLTVLGMNVENCSGDCFEISTQSTLIIDSIRTSSGGGALIADSDGLTTVSMLSGDSSNGQTYKTTSGNAYPNLLPKGAIIARYTDNTWATLLETENATRAYQANGKVSGNRKWEEDFSSFNSSSPYGAKQFALTQLNGGSYTPSYIDGLINITKGTNPVGQGFRFSQVATHHFLTSPFEVRFIVRSQTFNSGQTIFRAGMYSLDATVKPTDGLGLRFDTGLGDTFLMLESIKGGVSTATSTGISATSFTGICEVIVTNKTGGANGLILTVRRDQASGGVSLAQAFATSTSALNGVFAAPAVYVGTSANGWSDYFFGKVNYSQLNVTKDF